MTAHDPLVRFLGWFSVGLGLTQLLAPRWLGRQIGAGDHPALMPALGLRELTAGVGILCSNDPAPWLWARVAGDGMDLGLLGAAVADGPDRGRAAAATAAVAGVTALDVYAAARAS